MEFFNPQEDVLDIQMTEYGKSLFSQGKFRPKFYSFSDEDVIYNTQKNQSPITQAEKQNEIGTRITGEDNIYNKVLHRRFPVNYEKTIVGSLFPEADNKQDGVNSYENSQDKFNNNSEQERIYYSNLAIAKSLGNIKTGSQLGPAFKVFVGTSNISGSSQYYSAQTNEISGHEPALIPQIEVEMIARTTIVDFDAPLDGPIKLTEQELENVLRNAFSINVPMSDIFADGGIPIIDTPSLFLTIEEENVDLNVDNFEIEVYEIGETISTKTGNQTLRKLEHRLLDSDFETVNNILLPEDEKQKLVFDNISDLINNVNGIVSDTDLNRVDYYIDILTDYNGMLGQTSICEYISELKSLGFAVDYLECPDRNSEVSQESNIYVLDNDVNENCS